MAVDLNVLAEKFTAIYGGSKRSRVEDIYKLAMDILIAEKRLEEAIDKAENERERKTLEKKLKNIKALRDKVVALYMYRMFGASPPW